MKHNLKISVFKKPQDSGIIRCRAVTIREKLLSRLLGDKRKVTILIPGDSVKSLSISEIEEEGGQGDE
jgi:hypothetical protein